MNKRWVIQRFPFLLAVRKAQKKLVFYMKMLFDANRYARTVQKGGLPVCVYSACTSLINPNTGFDIKYQQNKVFNLELAAKPMNGVIIRPGEIFSFWQLVRKAKKSDFKEGLSVEYGKLTTVKGGGLCHLSNFLFWMFLHTPLTIVERHPHRIKDFPSPDNGEPDGVDATVSEGWLDLKIRNQTNLIFQVELKFDGAFMHGRILANGAAPYQYEVVNRDKAFFKRDGRLFEQVAVYRQSFDPQSGQAGPEEFLYTDTFEVGYPLPEATEINETEIAG